MDTNTNKQPDHCGFCGKSRYKPVDNGYRRNCSLCGQGYDIHQICASFIYQESAMKMSAGNLQGTVTQETFNNTPKLSFWCLDCRTKCFFCGTQHQNKNCSKILCSGCGLKWCRVLPPRKKITQKTPLCQRHSDKHKTALCKFCKENKDNTKSPDQSTDLKVNTESGGEELPATVHMNAPCTKSSRLQHQKKRTPRHYLWTLQERMHEEICAMIKMVLRFGFASDGLRQSVCVDMDAARHFFDSRIMFFHEAPSQTISFNLLYFHHATKALCHCQNHQMPIQYQSSHCHITMWILFMTKGN